MPGSDPTLRPWLIKTLTEWATPDTWTRVVDCGAGAGAWLDDLKPLTGDATWTAIDIWAPYIAQFRLDERYDDVIIGDLRHLILPGADCYILGDCLEHMPAADATHLWDRARAHTRWLIAALPVAPYPQGPHYGNPYEAHIHHWTTAEVLALPGILDHATAPSLTPAGKPTELGAFIARGNLPPHPQDGP